MSYENFIVNVTIKTMPDAQLIQNDSRKNFELYRQL